MGRDGWAFFHDRGQVIDRLSEGALADEHDHVDGIEIFLAQEAAGEIGLRVARGPEFLANWA